ncbi:hypothetical protein B0H13DRAFT_2378828 [Mycena leptocephala]|nr:hypothetical protein B0H13DRAFT_2378828 [Mycena leptocephala]
MTSAVVLLGLPAFNLISLSASFTFATIHPGDPFFDQFLPDSPLLVLWMAATGVALDDGVSLVLDLSMALPP